MEDARISVVGEKQEKTNNFASRNKGNITNRTFENRGKKNWSLTDVNKIVAIRISQRSHKFST